MDFFRKLAHNVFFKIVLGLVALSFVFFGISGFITGAPNSWVAKVGDEKISLRTFEKNLEMDRRIFKASQPNNQKISEYLESEQFKADTLTRIIQRTLIEKISKETGAYGNEKIILTSIARDPNFRDKDGKFDRQKFNNFLAQNGLDETRYIREISNEISAEMILQTLTFVAPINLKSVSEFEAFNEEKRVADLIYITKEDIKTLAKLTDSEVEKFFNENKSRYVAPEIRKVSYAQISEESILDSSKSQVSEEELKAEYEKNKDQFKTPETRDLYHVVFDKKEKAEEFLKKLNEFTDSNKLKIKDHYESLAKQIAKKNLKEIALNKVAKDSLPKEISQSIFEMKIGETSKVIESQIGFHVFLLNEINSSRIIEYSEVKEQIKDQLVKNKQEKEIEKQINEINDTLLTSNSLEDVAKKFKLKIESAVDIDISGSSNDKEITSKVSSLKDFAKNAFSLQEKQLSKLFPNGKSYYALQIKEIVPAHQRNFSEAKEIVRIDAEDNNKENILKMFADSISKEIAKSPSSFASIAIKNKLRIEKAKVLPRNLYIDMGKEKMPYRNQFLEELFNKKIGEVTSMTGLPGQSTYVIGILREIKKVNLNSEQSIKAKKRAMESFAGDIMKEYDNYLQKKYPIEINKKILTVERR